MKLPAPLLFAAAALSILYAGLTFLLPIAPVTPAEAVRLGQLSSLRASYGTSLAAAGSSADLDPDGEFLPEGVTRRSGRSLAASVSLLPLLAGPPVLLLGTRGALLVSGAAIVVALAAACRLARLAFAALPGTSPHAMLGGVGAVAATPLLAAGARFEEWGLAALAGTFAFVALVRSLGKLETPSSPSGPVAGAVAAGAILGAACWIAEPTLLLIPAILLAGAALRGAPFARTVGLPLLAGATLPLGALAGWRWVSRGAFTLLRLPDPAALLEIIRSNATPALAALAAALLVALPPVRTRLRHRLPARAIGALAGGLALAILAAANAPLLLETWRDGGTSAAGLAPLMAGAPALFLLPAALLTRRPALPGAARFLGLAGGIYVALVWCFLPAGGAVDTAGAMLPAWPLLFLFLCGLLPAPHGPRGGTLPKLALLLPLGLGLAMQLGSLRDLASRRHAGAALAARIEAGAPEGAVVLTDVAALAGALTVARPAHPVFFVRPGADLNMLLSRVDQAGLSSVWVGESRRGESARGAVMAAGGESIDLGAGLVLMRGGAEAGTRGFSRLPEGD